MTSTETEKFDPYQVITDQVVALLEAGTAPWRKPWAATGGFPISLSTGKAYRGVNPFLLQISAAANGWTSPYWGTYKAIADKGGQVRKGEKGTLVVFWKTYLDRKEVDEKTGKAKQRFVLRTFKVFNADQADAAEGKVFNVPAAAELPGTELEQLAACEQAIAPYLATLASVSRTGTAAYYVPATDSLTVPPLESFTAAEEFYSTLFHEAAHSTGHSSRLNRPGVQGMSHFGDALYSKEELVAEMGAAMLSGVTGIAPATLDNSAAYLASWVRVLKGDAKLVISAAAAAQKAADKVLGVSYAAEAAEAA